MISTKIGEMLKNFSGSIIIIGYNISKERGGFDDAHILYW